MGDAGDVAMRLSRLFRSMSIEVALGASELVSVSTPALNGRDSSLRLRLARR